MQFELFGLHLELVYVLSGLAVGFIVGMTGVGGGSLMTPILLFFGISPSTAVGTDLLYAAITKSGGIFVHQKKGNIDWRITCLLAAGSLPAAAATLVVMHLVGFDSKSVNSAIKMALGAAPAPFFRYPGLAHTQPTLDYLGTRNIAMFSVDIDSLDFKSSSPDQVINTVMTKLDKQGKGIILMHDLQKNTAQALPTILRRLKAGGYKVVEMKAKAPLETLPEYDALMVKDLKVPAVSARPLSSVVQTVSQQ